MPVEKLPFSLESMLSILLEGKSLSSFNDNKNIEGRCSNTVVILRLSTPTGQHSRLATSQRYLSLRLSDTRSQRREQGRRLQSKSRTKGASGQSSSPSGLFLPALPTLFLKSTTPLQHQPNRLQYKSRTRRHAASPSVHVNRARECRLSTP